MIASESEEGKRVSEGVRDREQGVVMEDFASQGMFGNIFWVVVTGNEEATFV